MGAWENHTSVMASHSPSGENSSRFDLPWRISGDLAFHITETPGANQRTVSCSTLCSSGDRIEGTWRGIPLTPQLATLDPDTTHVLVSSDDGYRACIPIGAITDAIVALERLDGDDTALPRLVGPTIDGPRLAKRVAHMESIALSPEEDPSDLEVLTPEVPA